MNQEEAIKRIVMTYSSNCDECHYEYEEIDFIFNGKSCIMDLCEPCFKEILEVMEALNIDKDKYVVSP
jgi:hypothetical protein